jgi:hypothetical protein
MKLKVLVLFLLAFICSNCSIKSKIDIVKTFNNGYNIRNHDLIEKVLSPKLIVIDNLGNTVSNDRKSYFTAAIFWTEVFGTKWIIKEIKEENGKIITSEADSSFLNQFLYGQSLNFRYEYTIQKQKITLLRYYTPEGYKDLEKRAQKKYEQLFIWIAEKYPDKLKITSELSVKGAKELKKLLEKYIEEENNKT